MLPMEKSVTFTGACANEIIPNGQLARLLTKRKKEVMLELYLDYHFLKKNNIRYTLELNFIQWLLNLQVFTSY